MVSSEHSIDSVVSDISQLHKATQPWETNEYYYPVEVGLQIHLSHRSQHNKQINPPKRMVPYRRPVSPSAGQRILYCIYTKRGVRR